MNRLLQLGLLIALGSTALVPLTGCTANEPPLCGPSRLKTTPGIVSAGAFVVVSADKAPCDINYGNDQRYTFTLHDSQEATSAPIGSTSVNPDGSFSYEFKLPERLHDGQYELVVSGSTLDSCIPRSNESCAMYSTVLEVTNNNESKNQARSGSAL